MKRWISVLIMIYILLAISWWGYLLYIKNDKYYEVLINQETQESNIHSILEEKKDQSTMIVGEGIVLAASVLLGLWLINRSITREITSVNNQNNFLLSVSHELKSPIAAIKLAIQTLKRKGLKVEQKELLLDRAVLDSDRLEKMIENVLITANFDNSSFQVFLEQIELVDVISQIIREHQQLSHRDIYLTNNLTKNLYLTDESIIRTIVDNLLENAVKYSEPNERIDVKLYEVDSELNIQVEDLGIGIGEKDKLKVIDRFYRGDNKEVRKQKGTGLGLYIVKRLSDKLNGSLSISDNLPKGTIMKVKLPIRD